MPINPSIPLGFRPGPDPLLPSQIEQRNLTLANLGRQEKLDQQRLQMNEQNIAEGQQQQQERQAAAERAKKVSEIYAKHLKPGEDERTVLKRALPEIWGVDPDAAGKIDKQIYELDLRDFNKRKMELEQASTRGKRLAEIAGTAADQATLRRAVGMAVAEKLLTPEQAAEIGDTWDESTQAAVKQFRMQALDVQKQLDEARKTEEQGWKKADADRKAAAEKRAEELHRITLPSKTPDPETKLTPVQAAAERGREAERKEKANHNRAIEAKGEGGGTGDKEARSAISKLDTEAKRLQGTIDEREKGKGKLRQVKTQLESEIKSLEKDKPKEWREKVAKARAKWEGNEAQLREIESQQQDLVSRKEDLYGQMRGIKGGGNAPAAAPAARPRARNAQTGETVEWDGKQWVKVN